MLSAEEVLRELLERGCKLRPGALTAEINRLEAAIGSELAPFVKEIYCRFDGFVDSNPDKLTQMNIWSISEIVEFILNSEIHSNIIPFGDRLIYSDFMSCDMSIENGEVKLLECGEKLADSYSSFWFKLLNSEYDL